MAAFRYIGSHRGGAAVALLLAIGSIVSVPSPVDGALTLSMRTRAAGNGHAMTPPGSLPTAATTFSHACLASACGEKTHVQVRPSTCVFARLSPDRPPFAIIANPKSGSTTLRLMIRTFELDTLFEDRCTLDQPLSTKIRTQLGVTGWEQVSALVVVRQPMDRFISGWEEISLRAAASMGKPTSRGSGGGFEFLRDPQNLGPETPDAVDAKMLRRVRTADNFERYMKAYLELVNNTEGLRWDYDPHASMQVMRMGVCSQQSVRSITIVKMEEMREGIPNFLLTHADATEERDGAMLEAFRNPMHGRSGSYRDILDVRELVKQGRFKGVWEAVKHSSFMIADHICTGYSEATVDIPYE